MSTHASQHRMRSRLVSGLASRGEEGPAYWPSRAPDSAGGGRAPQSQRSSLICWCGTWPRSRRAIGGRTAWRSESSQPVQTRGYGGKWCEKMLRARACKFEGGAQQRRHMSRGMDPDLDAGGPRVLNPENGMASARKSHPRRRESGPTWYPRMWTSFLKRPKFRGRNTAQLSVQVSAPKSGRSSFESLGALRSARSRSGPGFGDGMRARSLGRGLALGRPCTVRFLQENKAFTHMHWLLSASPRPRFLGRIPSPKAGPLFEPWVCFLSNRGSAFSSRARATIHSSAQARGP